MNKTESASSTTPSDIAKPFINNNKNKNNELTAPEDQQCLYDSFPLTDIQHAYLIGSNNTYELGNTDCHTYFEFKNKDIDTNKLEEIINALIHKHDMLRVIINTDGTQKILKQVPHFKVTVNHFDNTENTNHITKTRASMSNQTFDYTTWPLFQIQITKSPEYSVIHFSFNLIAVDAFSIQKLIHELSDLYKGTKYDIEKPPISFRDYVIHEESDKKSEDYLKSLQYWQHKIKNWPGNPQLPLQSQPCDIKKPIFVRKQVTIDSNSWAEFKRHAKNHNLTPSSALLSVFSEIIRKWSSSDSFLINLTIFNRRPLHSQINQILGDFTSSLILEITGQGSTFSQRAKKLQTNLWTDIAHRRVSGVRVLRELNAKGSSIKYVPVVFTSLLGHEQAGEFKAIEDTLGEFQYGISQTPQVWIDHQVTERDGQLFINWDYIEELFPSELIADMFNSYIRSIHLLSGEADTWGHNNIILIPEYQKKAIDESNSTQATQTDLCLHELFLRQVDKQSNKNAIIDSENIISYKHLYDIAIGLATKLFNTGIRHGDRVAIIMHKGWEQVAAVLATNYIGAVYVPVDISIPDERRNFLLENTNAKVVLSQPEHKLLQTPEIPLIVVDRNVIATKNNAVIDPVTKPNSLAYIIYTSGSTGNPKGVAIKHYSAVNTILDINTKFNITSDDTVLALSSLSFDLSVYDIYGLLAAGGTIVFPSKDNLRDPSNWSYLMSTHNVTLWNSVPALMLMLVNYLENKTDKVDTLKNVLLSGDWIPVDLPGKIKQCANDSNIISLGGATEASIWSIYYPVNSVDKSASSIPYGKPLANQQFYILDSNLYQTPYWVTGDLYIAGTGLADCYWEDLDKTAEKFIIHPETKQRLYHTGDLGRYLPDANIEFLGRNDYQVKIQGFRVELGEIETALQEHTDVQTAIVSATGDTGHKKLIAYLVADNNTQVRQNINQKQKTENAPQYRAIEDSANKTASIKPFDENDLANFINTLEYMSFNIIQRNFLELGAFTNTNQKHHLENIIKENSIQPKYTKLVSQWVDVLIKEDFITRDNDNQLYCINELSPSDLKNEWIYLEQSSLINNQFLHYLKLSFDHQIDMLQDKISPLELFFPQGNWDRALGLYESNPLSEYYNSILSSALINYIDNNQEKDLVRILEVGAGTGGTSAAILTEIKDKHVSYTFTDLTTFFTEHAKQRFSSYDFIDYKLLDIDKDPAQQGYSLNHYDIIVASNVLHDAHNIHKTLNNLAMLLKGNGVLLVREATSNSMTQMVSVGFIEGFSGYQDERSNENLPLLSVSRWADAFIKAGFLRSTSHPNVKWPFKGFQENILIAYSPSTKNNIDTIQLERFLADKLPAYMIPEHYIFLDNLPLTNQGKVDRNALPTVDFTLHEKPKSNYTAPATNLQQSIADIWQDILKVNKVGIDDNFFDIGGDSLYLTFLNSKLEKDLSIQIPMTELFRFPTIRSLTDYLNKNKTINAKESGSRRGDIRKNSARRRLKHRKNTGISKEHENV